MKPKGTLYLVKDTGKAYGFATDLEDSQVIFMPKSVVTYLRKAGTGTLPVEIVAIDVEEWFQESEPGKMEQLGI